jgi:hypothetical protein
MSGNIVLSVDGENFIEVKSEFDPETGVDVALEKIKEKNKSRPEGQKYIQYFDMVSPKGEKRPVAASIFKAAQDKGYKLDFLDEAEREVNPVTPFEFEKQTGPGTPEFLKSATLQTARAAAPVVTEGIATAGRQMGSLLKGETPKPLKEEFEGVVTDFQDTVTASPSGKTVGDIAGGVLGSAAVIGALGKAGRGARMLGETAYEGAAGTGEGLMEGEDLPDALGRGALRASLANVGEVASVIPGDTMAAVGTTGGYAANVLGKSGIKDPAKRQAIDILTLPKGAPIRAEITNRGGQLDTLLKEFETQKQAGIVKNFDDYYAKIQEKQSALGGVRNKLVNSIPRDALDTKTLIKNTDEIIKDFESYLPKDSGNANIRRAISEYQDRISPSFELKDGKKVYGPFIAQTTKDGVIVTDRRGNKFSELDVVPGSQTTPNLQEVYRETQNLRTNIKATFKDFYGQSATPPPKTRVIQSDKNLESLQENLIEELEPELQGLMRRTNRAFSDNYSRKDALDSYTRQKTGGVTPMSKLEDDIDESGFIRKSEDSEVDMERESLLPQEDLDLIAPSDSPNPKFMKDERSSTFSKIKETVNEPKKASALSTQLPENLQRDLDEIPLMSPENLQEAIARGQISDVPQDLRNLAVGAQARLTRKSGEESAATQYANLKPLDPTSTMIRRMTEGGLGESIARKGDWGRQSLKDQFSSQPEPNRTLKSRLLEAGVSGTARGGAGSFEGDLNPLPPLQQPRIRFQFNQEQLPDTLKSVIRTASAPLASDTLLSLSNMHGIPVEELTRLFEKYAQGVEP